MSHMTSPSDEIGIEGFWKVFWKIFALFSVIVGLEVLGLAGAILFAWAILFLGGGEELQSYPWSTALVVDFVVIIISAILAEIAAPSRPLASKFSDLMFMAITRVQTH